MTEEEIAAIIVLIERNNRTVDRSIASYIQTLRLLMQSKILEELSKLPKDRTLQTRTVLRILGGLETLVVEDEKVAEHIASLQDIFDLQSRLSEAIYRITGFSPEESKVSDRTLNVFVASREQNIEVMARAYANEVRQSFADSVISGIPISDFELSNVEAPRIFQALENDLKTSSAGYERLKALGINSRYVLYAGPRDARNRPFCAERVNNIYPTEIVYTWDNGQGIPAYLYCGGYGCRHMLVPVNEPKVKQSTGNR